MKTRNYIYILLLTLTISCSKSSNQNINENNILDINYKWTVPLEDLLGNFNPFPLAENPTFSSVDKVEGLNDESTVMIVSFNERVNIYPLTFVHQYETVNDTLNNNSFTISFCPITQSTININRNFNNQKLTFRASGILYKENLVMHDNNSDSFWSQMLLKNIKGPFENEAISIFPMIETSWKTAKEYFPSANVFTNNSIVSSKNNNSKKIADNIVNGEKVFGIINNINIKSTEVFIYQYSQFENGIKLFNNGLTNKKIVVGSQDLEFITAFFNEENYIFEPIQNEFPLVMSDQFGNEWNAFGIAVSGPSKGEKLKSAKAFAASWWAWKSFYSNFEFQH